MSKKDRSKKEKSKKKKRARQENGEPQSGVVATLSGDPVEVIRASETEKIKVAITDIDGILRGKYLHRQKFLSAAESGFGFCNVVFGWDSSDVCYDNAKYTGWHTGYPDAMARIDPKTFRRVPWDGGVPFFLADFEDEAGKPLAVCPRQLLKSVLRRAKGQGFSAKVGMEFEWFNFAETPTTWAAKGYASPTPVTPGMFGYSLLRMSRNLPFFNALFDELAAFGVPIEGLHTETGPGVLEAAILFSDALESADRAVLFKTSTKEIAARFGIMPTFMARWNGKLPGSSGHIHQSLWNDEENAFYDSKDPLKMSKTFKSYLAGVQRLLPEFLVLFAPTVNSYKRLVEGYWAPTRASWGVDNRTVALRVLPGSKKSTRLEFRTSGADVNPYLAMAGCIAAGLYGVENELELKDPPIVGSGYIEKRGVPLPRSLEEATAKFSQSKVARDLLGDAFVDHFVSTRDWEFRQFRDSVTSWELERYFEII
jgi:glutamine synthetase